MNDKPKLTLSNPKNKLNSESKLSKNTKGVSLTETLSQDKSNRQNSSSTNLPNKSLKINIVKTDQSTPQVELLLTHEEYLAILEYLQKTYPKCFPVSNTPLLPLAVGIHKQLLASEELPFAKVKIRRFLKRYTRSKEYRRNLIIESPRVDLQGNQIGIVTEEEVNRAKWREVKGEKIKKANHDSLIKKALENPLSLRSFYRSTCLMNTKP